MARRAKGEGSLYQAKDKNWIYQYQVDGQRKTKRFRRKSDALAYIKALSSTPAPVTAVVPAAESGTNRERAEDTLSTPITAPMEAPDTTEKEEEPSGPPLAEPTAAVQNPPVLTPTAETQNLLMQNLLQMQGIAEVVTVADWMDRWLEVYIRPTVKLSTYCSYELYIRGHIKPKIGGLYMNTIRVDDLQAFFNDRQANGNLKGDGGLSPKTLTNMRNMMHLAFDQAVKNRLLFSNIVEAVRLPRLNKNEMRVLSREEQDRLITAARLAPEPAAFGIIFDLFTGLRLGELCALRWENVNLEQKTFLVCETRNRLPNFDDTIKTTTSVRTVATTKTDNSRRTVFIMDNLYQDLLQYKAIQDSIAVQYPKYNSEGYVFCQECGRPYEPRTFQDLFKRCVRQAGIRDANFHALLCHEITGAGHGHRDALPSAGTRESFHYHGQIRPFHG